MSVDPGQFADHYNRIAALAPSLAQRNPGVTGALAQASVATGGLPAGLVESTAGLQRAVSFANELRIQTPDIQAAVYGRLQESDRNLLAQLGYTPPAFNTQSQTQAPHHRGFFGSIGHALGQAAHATLDALGVPIHTVQHTWRTIAQNAQTHQGGEAVGALFSSHDWMAAWNQTKDGNKSYDLQHLGKVQGQYSPDVFNLAKQMNDGAKFDELAPVGSPQRDQLSKIAQSDEFKKAYADINEAHLSPGRTLVYGLGIPDPTVGSAHVVSGALDGTFDILMDPTLQAGRAVRVYKAVRYGLTGASADDIDRMFQARKVRNGWDDISKQLNTIRESPNSAEAGAAMSRINDAYPTVTPLVQHLLDAGVHDVDSAQEFLRGNVGLGLLLRGQPFREMPLMPKSLSPIGEAMVASKKALRKTIDWRAFGSKVVPNPDNLLNPEWAGSLFEHRKGVAAGVPLVGSRWALLARRASTRVPMAETFNPLDPSAPDIIRRVATAFLPTWHADQISAAFLKADLGGKRTIYKGLLGQLMHASGAALNEPGRHYYAEMMDDLDQWAKHTAYTAEPGVFVRPTESGQRELGGLSAHFTENWSLPSFKGMVEVAGRAGFFDRIGAQINRPGMDKFMRFWRWQVLTRPGFGLRAGADELLGAVMRGGGVGLTKAFAAQRAIHESKPTVWDPAVGLARVVAKALPDGAAAKVNNVGDLVHQWTLGGVGTVMRKGAAIIAGPEMIQAARTLSEDPMARQGMADILHTSRTNDVLYDGSAVGESAKQGMPVAELKFGSDGAWDVRTANGHEGAVRWSHELEKLLHDPAGAKAARVIADGTEPEAQRVELIRQVLASESYASTRARAEIADIARDGRRVSKGEVDQDVALRDWAQDIHDHAVSLLSSHEKSTDPFQILRTTPVPVAAAGKRQYQLANGFDTNEPDYHRIRVNDERHKKIAKAYGKLPEVDNSAETRQAYEALRDEVNKQYDHMTNNLGVHVEFVDHDPYASTEEMIADVRDNKRLKVFKTNDENPHPHLTAEENDKFRAVHDFFGHAAIGRGFDRHGEEAAFVSHARMFSKKAQRALASETRGQNAYLNYGPKPGEFGPQKAALLPREFSNPNNVDYAATKDGRVLIKPVLDHILEHGEAPGVSTLAQLRHRPEGVVGKMYVPIAPDGGWTKFSNAAFHHLAVRPLNFLSRHPLTTYHYAQARKIYAGLEDQLLNAGHGKEAVEDLIHRHSLQRAVEHTASYVHNPKMRTQLSVITRNFLPFRHAEEGFFTRWSRTIRDNPATLRKMQLTVEGLAHSGVVQTDEQTGQPVFVYPGTGFAYSVIAHAHNLIPGLSAHPIPTDMGGAGAKFTSPLWYLNPGLTQLSQGHVYPQAGPLAALSVGVIRRMFPESELPRQAERDLVGEQGAGKPLWAQFVPTVMQRLYSTWGERSDTDGQLASATRAAIQYLDATGQTPEAGASPEDVDHYINRVKAMTRTLMTMRVALGFIAPAAPSAPEFDKAPDPQYAAEGIRNMRDEFVALTKRMPYDEAIAEFQRQHPDDSPFKGGSFLASQSKTTGNLYLPSTQKALDWMSNNASFLKNYKLAGPLLIPDDAGEFNYDAYREQLALGLRSRQSVKDFYSEIKIQNAERQYYAVRDQRDQLIADAESKKDHAAVQQINHLFDNWSADFQAVNPLFREHLASGGLRAEQRAEAMDQILKIVQDPSAPIDPSLRAPLEELAGAYAGQQADLRTLKGYTTSGADALRKQVNAQFENTVAALIAANPRLVDLYNRVLRPMEA